MKKNALTLFFASCLALAFAHPTSAATITWNNDSASGFDVTIDGYLAADQELSGDAFVSTTLWPGDFTSSSGLWSFSSMQTHMSIVPPGPLDVDPFTMCAISWIGVEFLGGDEWFGAAAPGYGLGSATGGSNPFFFGGTGAESWSGLASFQFLSIGDLYDFSSYHFQFHLYGSGDALDVTRKTSSVPDAGSSAFAVLMAFGSLALLGFARKSR